MTTYQNNRGEKWLFVECPPNMRWYATLDDEAQFDVSVEPNDIRIKRVKLPTTNYTLICTSDEITEEQAALIVDKVGDNLYNKYDMRSAFCMTALLSFSSLLHSLSLPRVVVLKIEE